MRLPYLTFLLLSLLSTVSQAVERIVSLAPSSTELVYAAGLGDKLVAVSAYSDYPEEAKQLQQVASFNNINVESVIALNPDLIVAWRSGDSGKALRQLDELGFEIYYSDTSRLAEIATRIEELSLYSDNPQVGRERARQFRHQLAKLKNTYGHKEPVSYFYQLSSKPIYTIARQHWPSEVFSLCGGVNVFEESPIPYPQVGLEQVIAKAPQAIFTSPHIVQNTDMWHPWSEHIPAVANHHIWSLNADWLNRPTPRSLKAVEQVCQYLEQLRNKNNVTD